MFKKILIPVDLSHPELSAPALGAVRELARSSRPSLRLISVVPLVPNVVTGYLPEDFEDKQRNAILGELRKMVADIDYADTSVTLRSGSVDHEVLAEAETFGADLIVMGSSQPGLATYIIGTHARDIVRHAKCSVLVLRQG